MSSTVYDGRDAMVFYLSISEHFISEHFVNHDGTPDWASTDLGDVSSKIAVEIISATLKMEERVTFQS